MTKKYDFNYEDGKYVLKYSNPNITDEPFEICADNMQFDTKKFYVYIFSDIKEKLDVEIQNSISLEKVGADVAKKGERVFKVIDDLCKEITNRINVECFGEHGD